MEPNPQPVVKAFVGRSAKKLQEFGIKFPERRDNTEHYGMGVGGMVDQVRGKVINRHGFKLLITLPTSCIYI